MVLIPLLASIALSANNGGVGRMFNVYILALVMEALYFDHKKLLGYGTFQSLLLIILYTIKPTILLPSPAPLGEFIPRIGVIIAIVMVLYLLTK